MILWVRDRLRNLSPLHYGVIVVTILVPVVLTAGITYFAVECLLVRVIIDVAAFLVWALFVVIVFALVVEKDRAEANQLVSEQVDLLVQQLRGLREEHHTLITGLGLQVEDLEERAQSALRGLGVELPPKLKPRWDVHLQGVGNQAVCSGGDLRPWIAVRSGSAS